MKILKSKVLKNGIWLYALQFFNTVVPLLTLPYITRVLGSEQFGVFSFALNIIGYIIVIVEYGFNLLGARKVALAKDKRELNQIYSRIMACKLILCIGTLLILIIVGQSEGFSKELLYSMLILYIMVFGLTLQQTWLFQGLQNMKFITIINVISRTISVIAIFMFIKSQDQVYLYCFLYSITFLLNGIISLFIVFNNLKVQFTKVGLYEIKTEFKDGWHLFTTNAMSKIFSGFGVTVLGIVSVSKGDVGIYAAIQKIPTALALLYSPIGQAIYPYVSQIYETSYKKGFETVKKVMKVVVPIVMIICITIIVTSEYLVRLLFGDEYATFYLLLVPLIIWMFFSIINNFLGIQILVASGNQKKYSKAFRQGVVALIFINLILGYLWGAYGIAIAAMLAEITLSVALLYQIKKIK